MQAVGFGAVLLSSFFFGFNGYFAKVGYGLGFSPLRLLTVRFTVAAIVMWGIMVWFGKNKGSVSRPLLFGLAAQGAAYALTALGFFKALELMPAGLVGIFFYMHPLVTLAFARVLWGERASKYMLGALLLAIFGAALVSWSGGGPPLAPAGLLWIDLSACSYAAFTLIGQKTPGTLDAVVVSAYSITFCALFLSMLNLPLYMLTGELTAKMWLVGLGIAIVCTVLAILLYVVGIKSIGASRTAILSAAEPLSGVLIAAVLLNGRMFVWQWAGMALIVGAVAVSRKKGGN
ncbi:MAG: hypothetical protein DDT20_01786 [Firmicutes bacterium]|nr:hypothetical protein [Bacillota bacterium]